MPILESRASKIDNRIVRLSDLARLAAILEAEGARAQSQGARVSTSFMVRCFDNSTFESRDAGIFAPGSFLESKRVISTELSFFWHGDKDDDRYIRIELAHDPGSFRGSEFMVRGPDSTWVNGVTASIQSSVNYLEWNEEEKLVVYEIAERRTQ